MSTKRLNRNERNQDTVNETIRKLQEKDESIGSVPIAVASGGTGQITAAEAIGELTQALTEDTSPDRVADYVGTYDASADTGKKVALYKVSGSAVILASTFSGATELDFDFSTYSQFSQFRIYLRGVDMSADGNLFVRLSDDGGATFEADAADYWWSVAGDAANDVSDSEIQLNGVTTVEGSTAGATSFWVIDYMPGAASSIQAKLVWLGSYPTSGGGFFSAAGAGGVLVSGTYTDLRVLPSTGTFSGSYTVIGII